MDELVFEALMPMHMKRIIRNAQSIAKIKWRLWRGLDGHALVSMLSSFALLAVLYYVYLDPYIDVLVEARDALCAGDQEFVYSIDGAGVLAWTYPSGVDQ